MNRVINVQVSNTSVSLQIFDALYAYRQHLHCDNSYESDWQINFSDFNENADINILFDSMPSDDIPNEYIKKFDLIFVSNASEPLWVSTDAMHKVQDFDNVYYVVAGILSKTHLLYDKVISFVADASNTKDYFTGKFYPHFYENYKNASTIKREPTIIAINGQNRTWRHHFFNKIKDNTNVNIFNSIYTSEVVNTNHSYWETDEDTTFRCMLESKYRDEIDVWVDETDGRQQSYYDTQLNVGINAKFGKIPPGYSVLPIYFVNSCVIYPETAWQNDELTITEKTLKCFYAKSLPFAFGGSNINTLLNENNFYTAWNLLPTHLQQFDFIKDHEERYTAMIDAIRWLNENPDVFLSNEFSDLVGSNLIQAVTGGIDVRTVKRANDIIEGKMKEKV
jgi:hypothetical protein